MPVRSPPARALPFHLPAVLVIAWKVFKSAIQRYSLTVEKHHELA